MVERDAHAPGHAGQIMAALSWQTQLLERFECQCKGSAALLEGDCGVADARQGTTLPMLGALHSPPSNTADRYATLTLTLKPL